MAQGDITKEIEYDKIEVVSTWSIQVRQATKIVEEQADGSKKELTRTFHRHVLQPFSSVKSSDDKWTHTATDISGEDASVQAIANAAWSDEVKNKYKTWMESQKLPGE
tara:strand:+ start:2376 stop:2699 length:324 start_codon:yes stop_codon:yes gene_type:complete